MNYKSFLLTVLSISFVSASFSQANILNAKSPEEIGVRTEAQKAVDNDKPLEYGYVDDRDIMFSKMTWERVVLDERVNFPLYYPVDTNNIGKDRRSLFDVLWKNVKDGNIENIYDDSYFTTKRTLKDIKSAMSKVDTLDIGYEQFNADGYVDPEYIVKRDITSYDISAYLIKGLWYFDKRQAELKYRLLGIAPAAPDVNFIDSDDEANKEPIPLFWVFFPDAREILHEAKSFNNENSAVPFSYDHLLNSRRFNGYIYKEENVYGDRKVTEYISENALMQLLESDRIKEKIRDFELDMWAY
ncbi:MULTISPECIES: gliding motility protein GldN [Xanthomarina]|jgi:gliding motility associated protien GldN|uniref:Gliding motility protein GldN n=1 Tax=Xanthomarina gelatinilytica TaxID=1137281 RepID=A0A3D6BNG2_9FLAO|nr:gliding motility protein GldN [Xanthomarina sp.]MAL24104.1 gliding motility protein GldN [Xanthomarina sp.]MBF61425.1 gliding motility protein GldN [Xanthomarina sp.]HCY80538.1 gliding motility protein GldN [Xanthomarina gelatinilytica]|tara:strand:+ start:3917 stop:4816 length:900 start_codon:yes stop_codon:yes gene_type:complete